MPLVIKSEDKETSAPHLALTHEAQGFSANNRHVSLLMKSDAVMTDEVLQMFKSLGIVDINKAGYYSTIRNALQSSVQDKFGDDDSWSYIEDFNDTEVIFCTKNDMYSVSYTMTGDMAVLGDLANPVTAVISYSTSDGKMLLSEDAEDKLEEGVYSLLTKTLNHKTTQEHLIKVFKEKAKNNQQEVELLEQEIKKAVEAAEKILKAQLQSKEEELLKAHEEIKTFKAEKEEVLAKSRKAAISDVEKDEAAAEELFKSLQALPEEAFDAVIKALKKKVEQVEQSDLLKEVGSKGREVTPEKPEGVNKTADLLKAQFQKEGAK